MVLFQRFRCAMSATCLRTLVVVIHFVVLSSIAYATVYAPWGNDDTARAAQTVRDGAGVQCVGVVIDRIAARNNPPYFVVRDVFDANSRIVVLGRPPLELARWQSVDISGIMGTLPNNERCIYNPAIYGYYDKDGHLSYRSLIFALASRQNRRLLMSPTSPIPPSDPSQYDDGLGISGEVTANVPICASRYATVASLLATVTPVQSRVELIGKPVISVGKGFILVGDDTSKASVKVYTNSFVKSNDRVIKISGTVQSENHQLVIYADSGPWPYYDYQGIGGEVWVTGPGTVAYASTLPDISAAQHENGDVSSNVSLLSVNPPSSTDGSWVYLTGQVVTAVGRYYSYDKTPDGWVYIYNIQGLDGTSGIRVYAASSSEPVVGDIVDVMAKLDTKDGERLLGQMNAATPSDTVFCDRLYDSIQDILPLPMGMTNRDLGGSSIGNNPGITGSHGLYNIGRYVTVWGKVIYDNYDPYFFDQNNNYSYWVRIDDGSGVSSGDGVIVFSDSGQLIQWYDVDTYLRISGISSVWKPNGSSDTYRAIWLTKSVLRDSVSPEIPTPDTYSGSGTISGTVTLYDMPTSSAQVTLYSTCGRMETLTVTRGAGNTGTCSYSWSDVPTIDPSSSTAYYLISAKCDGYKTRTYTDVTPGTTRNLYLTPLRKLTLRTQNSRTSIDCTSGPLTIYADVVNDNNSAISGRTVRFMTNVGSFNSVSLGQTATATTNAGGTATVTLYGMRWAGTASITATDDTGTPNYYPTPPSDEYRCDWAKPIDITLYNPTKTVNISASPTTMSRCSSSSSTITANVLVCGSAVPNGTQVRFTIPTYDPAVFVTESGVTVTDSGKTATAQTTLASPYGRAIVHITPDSQHHYGTATITATIPDYPGNTESNNTTTVTIREANTNVTVSANPVVLSGSATSTITVTAAVSGLALTIRTTSGTFPGGVTQVTRTTGAGGTATVSLSMSSTPSAYVSASYTDGGCSDTVYRGTVVAYRESRWNSITTGVDHSSPLVDDLVPGDGKEVAVICKGTSDGKIHIWGSDGSSVWTSTDIIDKTGNNTLSAADIDGRGGLEITAPGGNWYSNYNGSLYAYGYNSGFKPLAGWPVISYYYYNTVAAALGDSNLDGTIKVTAGDDSCAVVNWNSSGEQLWRQITSNLNVFISNSTVAMGDINPGYDNNHIPDAVVGSQWNSSLHTIWGFSGDEWHDYYPDSYSYTDGWVPPDSTPNVNVKSSPAIGLLDNDSYNDIAIGDEDGRLYMWLSSTSNWVCYKLSSTADESPFCEIESSPAIVTLNNQKCVVVGCNNGRVYAIKSDGTPITGWPSTGILLNSYPRHFCQVFSSPIVGDVTDDGDNNPQIVVGTTDGDVYVIWSDGYNHSGGPIAKVWTCAQTDGAEVNSTPAICSLNTGTVSLIVGSTDGMYKLNLYTGTTFDPSNTTRWPWPTFHRDNARTGCATTPSTTMVSSSIIGRVKSSNGTWLKDVSVQIKWYDTGTSSWVTNTPVNSRPSESRENPIYTVGNDTNNDEINEGSFAFNQLVPNRRYQLVVSKSGYTTQTVPVNSDQNIPAGKITMADITLQ